MEELLGDFNYTSYMYFKHTLLIPNTGLCFQLFMSEQNNMMLNAETEYIFTL